MPKTCNEIVHVFYKYYIYVVHTKLYPPFPNEKIKDKLHGRLPYFMHEKCDEPKSFLVRHCSLKNFFCK